MIEIKPQIVSKTEDKGVTKYILKNGTKLGDVLDFLPHGIIQKNITGIGATTLELNSLRNSIIVEPLMVIASSKAHKHTRKSSYKVLYVGSITKLHEQKVTEKEIREYITDSSIPYKKIIVVADSLHRVMRVMATIGNDVSNNYFFMIDEVDSFQNDSPFRARLEKCLDFYKDFPKNKRALVSATHIGYTDPALEEELITTFEYETPTRRPIILTHSDNVLGTASETLWDILDKNPTDKFVVAYNHVAGCKYLADLLVTNDVISQREVTILCSANSKEKAGPYYGTLDGENLPTRVNFLTSAYFTGVDIGEAYHLFTISNPKEKVTLLSEHKLKQIAGRCRAGLLSEHIIYGSRGITVDETTPINSVQLVEAANDEIKALDCFTRTLSQRPLLESNLKEIRNLIVKETQHWGYSLVRMDINDKPAVSYFNIDACLETYRVNQELYGDRDALKVRLEKDEDVTFFDVSSSVSVVTRSSVDILEKQGSVDRAMRLLKDITSNQEVVELLDAPETDPVCRIIFGEFLYLHEYVEKGQLLEKLQEGFSAKDTRAWSNFKRAAEFAISPINNPLKRSINHHFTPGEKFTLKVLGEKFQMALADAGMSLRSGPITKKVLNSFVELDKKKNHKKGTDTLYEIVSTTPGGVKVRKYKSDSFSALDFEPQFSIQL